MKWIMGVLFKLGIWTPVSFKNKVTTLSGLDIDIYKFRFRISATTNNITDAVVRIETILNIDMDTGYAIVSTTALYPKQDILIYKWYSHNRTMVDPTMFYKWLYLVSVLYVRYEIALSLPKTSKAYRNAIKISPLMDEADDIVSKLIADYRNITIYD